VQIVETQGICRVQQRPVQRGWRDGRQRLCGDEGRTPIAEDGAVTRRYGTTVTSGHGPPGPPRAAPVRHGVVVVPVRAPRVGKSAAEEDGVAPTPPIDYAAEAGVAPAVVGRATSEIDNILSTSGGQHAVTQFDDETCAGCGRAAADVAVLVTVRRIVVCDECVMAAVDAVQQEMPRRRLRLAMERLAQGPVTAEMLEVVERLAARQDERPRPASTYSGGGDG